jgi:hypothetical protein
LWLGQVSRGEWILFVLSTPIMFYSASVSGFSLICQRLCLLFVRNSTGDRFRNSGSCGDREVEPL